MENNTAINMAIEALEYIKKNNIQLLLNHDIIKAQLALCEIRDNCKISKKLDINQYNI
jgi:uncharacterized protein (DUF305 family)